MMMRRPMKLLFWVVVVNAALCFVSAHSIESDGDSTLRLELVRRKTLGQTGNNLEEHIKELVENDMNRQSMISDKRRFGADLHRRKGLEMGAAKMPLQAGRDFGTGQYLTQLMVGTPPKKYTVVVDTGSDLTWVNCRYRCGSRCAGRRRGFNADLSSSFKPVPCSSRMCKVDLMNLFSLTTCPAPLTPCAYDFRYLDGSASKGIFAKETVTVGLTNGRTSSIHDVLVGCSDSFQGESFEKADGVLGLAYSNYSFTSKAAGVFGGKFSYCLVDHLSHMSVSNYLTFGNNKNQKSLPPPHERCTKLELDLIPSFYAVNVMGISIGGQMLNIPPSVWDAKRQAGTIVDSGTSLTFLTAPAYRPVLARLKRALAKYKRIESDGVPMEYCFDSTGFDERGVPRLAFHFVDGGKFEPHRKSYVIDVAPGVKCLGFVLAASPGTNIIGSIMQQNYFWEFDLVGKRLAFTPSTCA